MKINIKQNANKGEIIMVNKMNLVYITESYENGYLSEDKYYTLMENILENIYMSESGNDEVIFQYKKCKTEIKSELSKLKALAKKGDPDDKDKVKDTAKKCHDLIDESYRMINSVKLNKGDNSSAYFVTLMKQTALIFGISFTIKTLINKSLNKSYTRDNEDNEWDDFESVDDSLMTEVTLLGLATAGTAVGNAVKQRKKNRFKGEMREISGMNPVDAYNMYKQKYSKLINEFHNKVDKYVRLYEKNAYYKR